MKRVIILTLLTFFSLSFYAIEILPGNVSGNWTIENSPYQIMGNIQIVPGDTLTIAPGCLVEFQGHYSLDVEGLLLAIGESDSYITFTVNDTTGFSDMSSGMGGWHGIRINNGSLPIEPSIIRYCDFSFGKAVGETEADKFGGAIYTSEFSELSLSYCIFSNNAAFNGGAIAFSHNNPNRIIRNCIFIENRAIRDNDQFGFGGAVYLNDCSYYQFENNLVANNSAFIGGGYYGYSTSINASNDTIVNNSSTESEAGIYSSNYMSLENTILWENIANDTLSNLNGSASYIHCNVQGGTGDANAVNCLDLDPLFMNSGDHPFSLQTDSYCIDEGYTYDYMVNSIDVMGNPRVFGGDDGIVDIGAYEFQGNTNHLMKPGFSHPLHSYNSAIELELTSSVEDVQIYYTLDGSIPDDTSTLYEEAIYIQNDTTVKAIAYKDGWNHSLVAEVHYEIGHLQGNLHGTLSYREEPYPVDSNIYVNNDYDLVIEPGVTLMFMGDYEFNVYGGLQAEGLENEPIVFTRSDTTGFSSNTTDEGSWGGIKVRTNEDKTFLMKKCTVEFGKNMEGNYTSSRGGGFDITGTGDIRIENCIIQNCKARYGGAIEARTGGSYIFGNLIQNNYASNSGGGLHLASESTSYFIANNILLDNVSGVGSAISATSGNTLICNNTIIDNLSTDSSLILIYGHDQVDLVNNIIWRAQGSENLIQIGSNPITNFRNCNIKGDLEGFNFSNGASLNGVYEDNIAIDPGFSEDTTNPFSLTMDSYCVNSGLADMSDFYLPEFDFAGNPRIFDGTNNIIDIGAYEYQGESTIVAKPVFSLDSGFYPTSIELELICITENSEIYYTLDGSEPDENSSLYNNPIAINSNIDVKAKAYADGLTPSLISQKSYIFGTALAGDFDGTLTLDNSPYILTDSLQIQLGSALIIEPGVEILATENGSINVYGYVTAIGTEVDSIRFGSISEAGRWRGFKMENPDSETPSDFEYCAFENASKSGEDSAGGAFLINNYDDLNFKNCLFKNNSAESGGAVQLLHSGTSFDHCIFIDNGAPSYGGAIKSDYSSPQITYCRFINNTSFHGGAISFYNGYSYIHYSVFERNSANDGGAIRASYTNLELINNLFFLNKASNDGCALDLTQFGAGKILNCTFARNYGTSNYNASVIHCYDQSSPQFTNCIFWDSAYTEVEVVNCPYPGSPGFFNCTGKIQGQVIDPLFVDSEANDFHLLEDSPAIDTGLNDPYGVNMLPWDLDNLERIWDGDGDGVATVDIGVYEYGSESLDSDDPVIEIPNEFSIANYPNPFNPETTIKFSIPVEGKVKVSVFNIKGQKIKTIINENHKIGNYSLKWFGKDNSGNSVSSGIYFYQLSLDGKSKEMGKMILLK